MIVNYAFSLVNKLKALLTDDARVIIYNRHVFIVQATGGAKEKFPEIEVKLQNKT